MSYLWNLVHTDAQMYLFDVMTLRDEVRREHARDEKCPDDSAQEAHGTAVIETQSSPQGGEKQ